MVTGLFGDKLAARLYDAHGEVIREWPNDFFSLFSEYKKYEFDALTHGDYLYPNGDLLIVIDEIGMARISSCGDVIWKKKNGAHHSIDIDDDGYIWTPFNGRIYADPRLSDAPVKVDRIQKIDPETGERIETIELAEALLEGGLEGVIKGNVIRRQDVFHLNDVEILKKSMTDAFPMFKAGDILLSGRNTNAILLLDGATHKIKWWRVGPMHGQHDPDFQPNGEITIFDNRTARPASRKNGFTGGAGGSRILAINPKNYASRTIYQSNDENKFYSAYRGKHQILPNGSVLVTESEGGRAFEAAPDGRIIWMATSEYDEKHVGWLMSATRYPQSYARIGENCPATEQK